MIHQLSPTIQVDTPLGKGQTLFIIDYGIHQNTCWVVALEENGIVKHFDCNDITLAANYTYGINAHKGKRKEPQPHIVIKGLGAAVNPVDNNKKQP